MFNLFKVLLVACVMAAPAIHAQPEFPVRPVVIVVPSQPGGGLDQIGRLFAEEAGSTSKKSFVVDNRTGAGTLVGTRSAATAPPDGYTLLVGNQSSLVLNPALYSNAGYDAKKDFVDLGMVATYPYVLVARADLEAKSYAELAQMARSRVLTIATAGPGTIQHILAAALADASGIKLTMVHYKGAGAAYHDVLGGRIDLFIDAWPSVRSQLNSQRLIPLLTTGAQRLASLPSIPTAREADLAQLQNESWCSIVAPAKTPTATQAWLRTAVANVTRRPEWAVQLERFGMQPLDWNAERTQQFVASESARWSTFIQRAGIRAE